MQISQTNSQRQIGKQNDTESASAKPRPASLDLIEVPVAREVVNSIQISRRACLFPMLFLLFLIGLVFGPQDCVADCREEPARDCEAICDASGRNCTIRALVLLPDDNMYQASLPRVLPILKVAEQQIRSKSLIPPHIDFEWLAHDTKCDASLGVIKAMDGIIKQCAQVIFGPVCDYSLAAVSRITKYFNSQGTPLISVGGSTYDFEQKKTDCNDEFYMLLRTGMLSFETISELTINVMKR
ncbi:uncharacterized protein Dyak_GE26349 [Drosophila yakuba]|uniref:Receptor ligand binding region domain-containing protein n=2 Tax=Drosophila yakuba TaxID=7245 RepID=B4PRJ1_DROYA|nr:uncharacterized protein Dyak_GE26349 [Drosophila yakuba]